MFLKVLVAIAKSAKQLVSIALSLLILLFLVRWISAIVNTWCIPAYEEFASRYFGRRRRGEVMVR